MKALVLLSGGLDSSIALKLMAEQGIEVVALHFISPFCRCDGKRGCGSSARHVSELVGVELKVVFVGEEYLQILKFPRFGRGKNLNPCIDCRIQKFVIAKGIMRKEGASFIVTGEVLGQRPMSQYRQAMALIERESGLEGLVLRPLSAKILPPTIPERQGWVDRDKLLAFSGRSRKPQMELARDMHLDGYSCPGSGCLLTDPSFCRRLGDLMRHTGGFDLNDIELLKVGRHFRMDGHTKLVVGRDEGDNNRLEAIARGSDCVLSPKDIAGPTALIRGNSWAQHIEKAAGILVRYISSEIQEASIIVRSKLIGGEKEFPALRIEDESFRALMI